MEKGLRDEILLRLEKGKKKILAAKRLLDAGFYEDAISRAYYGVFHAAKAALLLIGDDPRSHDGVLHLFGLRFVKPKIFDEKMGVILRKLKEMRETADYNVLAFFSEEEVRSSIREAETFVNEIEKYIKEKLES
ncbi:MAG: HEPN domain-containing protein [Candidatus Njordarchaeales archaeon]